MTFSQVEYTGDGATVDFAITFPVLAPTEVRLFVDGVESTFTLSSALDLLTADVAPPTGAYVLIKRETSIATDAKPVVFFDGAPQRAAQLNAAIDSILYAIQEVVDRVDLSMQASTSVASAWDAQGQRITGLADGSSDTDAITLKQLNDSLLAAGSLPNVTVSNNNYGLFVSAGQWAVRSPAQIYVHLGLASAAQYNVGTGPANVVQLDSNSRLPAVDGRALDLTLNPSITALGGASLANPTMACTFTTFTCPNDTAATWSGTGGRITMATATEVNDTGGKMSADLPNSVINLLPGTYLAFYTAAFYNNATAPQNVLPEIAVTDMATPVNVYGSQLYPSTISSVIPHWLTVQGSCVFTIAVNRGIMLRMRNKAASSVGTLTCFQFGTSMTIVRIS